MERHFTFQLEGGFVFQVGVASFLSGEVPHEGALILMGGGEGSKKIVGCAPTMGNPVTLSKVFHIIDTEKLLGIDSLDDFINNTSF